MFGKRARIKRLEAEADAHDKEMLELSPSIGFTKEIQARVGKIAIKTGDFDKDLEDWSQKELRKAQDTTLSILKLKEKAKNTRIVNLSDIAVGQEVVLDFCEPGINQYLRTIHPTLHVARTITGLIQEEGILHILSDSRTIPAAGLDIVEDHEAVTFGSMIYNGSDARFTPDMYVDTEVVVKQAGPVKRMGLDLMQVTVGKQQVIER